MQLIKYNFDPFGHKTRRKRIGKWCTEKKSLAETNSALLWTNFSYGKNHLMGHLHNIKSRLGNVAKKNEIIKQLDIFRMTSLLPRVSNKETRIIQRDRVNISRLAVYRVLIIVFFFLERYQATLSSE